MEGNSSSSSNRTQQQQHQQYVYGTQQSQQYVTRQLSREQMQQMQQGDQYQQMQQAPVNVESVEQYQQIQQMPIKTTRYVQQQQQQQQYSSSGEGFSQDNDGYMMSGSRQLQGGNGGSYMSSSGHEQQYSSYADGGFSQSNDGGSYMTSGGRQVRGNGGATYITAGGRQVVSVTGQRSAPIRMPQNVEVMEGAAARLDFRIIGRRAPEIEWYRDGVRLFDDATHKILVNEDGQYSLMITNVTMEDNAVFACVAKDHEIEQRFEVNVVVIRKEVRVAPKFVTRLNAMRITIGQRLELHVSAVGTPTPRITWQRDGIELFSNPPNMIITTEGGSSTLIIMETTRQDSGWYTAIATNEAGSFSSRARINIEVEESVRVAQRELYYQRATRVIEPEGSPPRETIFLRHVEPVAMFERGEEEGPQFTDKPEFLVEFRDLRIMETEKAHFETRLMPIGDPDMVVEWYHNGRLLEASSRIITTYRFGYVAIYIHNVTIEDAGEYICRAVNRNGEASLRAYLEIQEAAAIDRRSQYDLENVRHLDDSESYQRRESVDETVRVKPRFVTELLSIDNLRELQTAHFEARVEPENDANMTIEWLHNNKPLTAGSRITTMYNFGYVSLDIADLRIEDSGIYICKAFNQLGEAVSHASLRILPDSRVTGDLGLPEQQQHIASTQLLEEHRTKKARREQDLDEDANQKATFTKTLYDLKDLPEGRTAFFECALEPQNDPNMQVNWFKDGQPLQASSRITTFYNFGCVSLTIVGVEERDTGVYTCVAQNALGKDETSSAVTVKPRKTIIRDSEHEESLDAIQQLEDREIYQREEIEDIDITQKPVFVSPLRGPEEPIEEGARALFETRVEPANDPNLTVEWFFNGKPLTSGHRFKTFFDFGYAALEVLYAFPQDEGTFSIRARNKLGEAVASKSMEVIGDKGIDRTTIHGEAYPKLQALESKRYINPDDFDEEYGQPTFVTPLRGTTEIVEGQAAHFECRIKPIGDPNLRVLWYHNGMEMKSGSRFKFTHDFGYIALDIAASVQTDAGVYTVLIVNEQGEAESSLSLGVNATKVIITDLGIPEQEQYIAETERLEEYLRLQKIKNVDMDLVPKVAPGFKQELVDLIDLPENQTAHFEATLIPVADPTMKVEWFKDDKPLAASSRITTFFNFGYVSLTIREIEERDIGVYMCVATNSVGRAVTRARLTVLSYDSIVVESQFAEGLEKMEMLERMKSQRAELEQQEGGGPPKFTRPLAGPDTIIEGESAHFETRLMPIDDPKLIVEWYFNGKILKSGHRFRTFHDFGYVALDILYMYPEDSGEYTARAVNMYGEDVCSTTIIVKAKQKIIYRSQLPKEMEAGVRKIAELEASLTRPEEPEDDTLEPVKPSFVLAPEPQVVFEGDAAKFSCRVTGFPRPRVVWIVNGNSVVNGSRYKLRYDGMYHLEIPKARQYDMGKIEVYVRNVKGESYVWTTLEVNPRNDDYRAVLQNSPRPWYDEASAVSKYQLDRKQCELEKVFEERMTPGGTEVLEWKTNEDDFRRIKVKQHLGEKELLALRPETHRYQTDAFYVDRKQNIREIKKDDDSEVKWMVKSYQQKMEGLPEEFGNRKVDVNVEMQMQKESRDGLEITRNIKKTETRTKESLGRTTQRLVQGPKQDTTPPEFTQKITPVRAYEGDVAVFTCEFKGSPAPDVTWYRESFAIQNSRDFQIETGPTSSTLTIREVYLEDSGVFSVKAENRGGSAKSSANLLVEEAKDATAISAGAPNFLKTIQATAVQTGGLVRLDARLGGVKPMQVTWLKNGSKLQADVRHKIIEEDNLHTLLVLEAMPEDTGQYECAATNQLGEARCAAKVLVAGGAPSSPGVKQTAAPQLIEQLAAAVVTEGSPVTLKCRIGNVKPNQVTWSKGDSTIKQSRYFRMGNDRDVFTLRISEAFPEDEGDYRCTAASQSGNVTTTAHLEVLGPSEPSTPSGATSAPMLSPITDLNVPVNGPARFVATFEGKPRPQVAWYKNGMPLKSSGNVQMPSDKNSCSLIIRSVSMQDEGQYMCRATNPAGQAETTARLTVESKT